MRFRHVVQAPAVSVASGVLAALMLVAGARWAMPSSIGGPPGEGGWTARPRAWFTARGFSPAELDAASGRHFAWTGPTVRIVVPELSRTVPYRVRLRVSAGRPATAPLPPVLSIFVDGLPQQTVQTTNEPMDVTIDVPPRDDAGVVLAFESSNTFVPGPGDRRTLGVVVEEIALESDAGLRPTSRALIYTALAVMLTVSGVLLCGVRGWIAGGLAAAIAIGFVCLLFDDAAFVGEFVERLPRIGAGAFVVGLVVAVLRTRWPSPASAPEIWKAVALVLAGSVVKLAVIVHPVMTVGDAIFQVHRAQAVHAGNYLFTSITPRPFYEFPYPVALFVAAQPFWSYFPTEMDLARLLRGLTLAADALVGLVLYLAARRHWGDSRIALAAAALWPFARAPFQGLCNANLTNVFGQGLFGVALGLLVWSFRHRGASPLGLAGSLPRGGPPVHSGREGNSLPPAASGPPVSRVSLVAATVFLTLSFLSHFSTLTVGLAILAAVAVSVAPRRRFAGWITAVTLAAFAISYVAYYSHFTDTFRKTAHQVMTTERVETTRSIAATPAVKARLWATGATNDYGLPGLPLFLAACAGAAWLVRQRRGDVFTRVLAGWALVWVAFSALGILTPIEMRASLATAPVFVALGAFALVHVRDLPRAGPLLAALLSAVIVWDAVAAWSRCLGS
jgi:hypothetical protein